MKKLILFLFSISLYAQTQQTLSGHFEAPDGSPFNGYLTLQLPVTVSLSGCGANVTLPGHSLITSSIINGSMTPVSVYANDCMTPRTAYHITVTDLKSRELYTDNWYVPTAASNAWDVGVFSSNKLSNAITVAIPQAIISTPASSQTITQPTGTTFTVNGNIVLQNLTVSGTATLPNTVGNLTLAAAASSANSISYELIGSSINASGTPLSGNLFLDYNGSWDLAMGAAGANLYLLPPASLRSGTVASPGLGFGSYVGGILNLLTMSSTNGNLTVTGAMNKSFSIPAPLSLACSGCSEVVPAPYNYAEYPTSPAALVSGSNTVTMTPCPLGVSGSDANLHVYVLVTGTPEIAAVTGGTCTSGAATGTLVFTAAGAHPAGYAIGSPTNGIYEAVVANPGSRVKIPAGTYTMNACMLFTQTAGVYLEGDTSGGTALNFGAGCDALTIYSNSIPTPTYIRHLTLNGPAVSTATNNGIVLEGATRVYLDDVLVQNFGADGVMAESLSGGLPGAFEIHVRDSDLNGNGKWGLESFGISNLDDIQDNYIGNNCRSYTACGNLHIQGAATNAPIRIVNNDLSGAGTFPYSGVTIATAYGALIQDTTSVVFDNNYVENGAYGTGTGVFYTSYATTISGIEETGNWINNTQISYASAVDKLVSYNNTFYGSGAGRSFQGAMTGCQVGPDTYLNSAPVPNSTERHCGFQITGTGTDPGCTATGDIGKFWINTASSSTTFIKICKSSSGTIGWSQITTTP